MKRQILLTNVQLPTSLGVRLTIALIVVALVGLPAHAHQRRVFVSSVPELYAAVNAPANAGAQIVIAPGTYFLDPSWPNGGRLELQEDMELIGQAGDPEAVVIDASSLPSSSTGSVRMGRGSNTLEWLTVQNHLAGAANIETDLAPTPAPTRIRVAHVIAQGGQRGIDFRAVGSPFNDRVTEGVFEDNVLRNNTLGKSLGMRILNTQGVTGSTLRATLRGNYVYGNQIGLLAASLNSTSNTLEIDSTADRFTNNRAGCWLMGGIGSAAAFNLLLFTAHGDEFDDNNLPQLQPEYTTGGGVVGLGAANRGSNNLARLEIFGSRFSGNAAADISAFGYYDPFVGAPAGTNNRLELRLSGITRRANVSTVPSEPADPGNTNAVVLIPPGRPE